MAVDDKNQKIALGVTIAFPILSTLILALRLYSRQFITKKLGWDDALIVAAWVLVIPNTYTTWMYINTNFVGIHFVDIPKTYDVELGQKYNFANQLLYNPILSLVKASVLLFLLHIVGQQNVGRYFIWPIFVLNILLMILIFAIDLFQCAPVAFVYDFTIPGGHCIDQGAFFVSTAAITIFTDILVLLVPTWITARLQMPLRRKIAVISLLSLGLAVTAVGIYRLVILVHVFYPTSINPDPTYSIGFCTSAVETNLAIITACGPALKPLVVRYLPHLLGTSYYPRSRGVGRPSEYARGSKMGTMRSNTHGPHRVGPMAYEMQGMQSKTTNKVTSGDDDDSEKGIMSYDGIMKTMNVSVDYAGTSQLDLREEGENRSGSGKRATSDAIV